MELIQENARPVWPIIDPWMAHAIREVKKTYGDDIDPMVKGKSLLKFGATAKADSNTKTTVATFGSVATINVNETYSTTNNIDKVVSSGADAQTLVVEGHTIDASGNLTFSSQEVLLTGQTPATLGTALARCNRMYVKSGTFAASASDLVGDIYAYASSGVTVTDGVPQTSTAVKARIVAGKNQTEKAATSISADDYWIITQVQASVSKGNASTVTADFDIEVRDVKGGVFRPVGLEVDCRAGGNQSTIINFNPYLIIKPNSDVRLVAVSNTNDAVVSGYIAGVLATKETL